jgi:hypothetical protein
MNIRKKGAEESNVIIFIILALVVAGLVIWFSYGFFGRGTAILDATDPVVQSALQACKAEMSISQAAWCTSIKYVPYAKQKQYVTCDYLNDRTGKTIEGTPNCGLVEEAVEGVKRNYCAELAKAPGTLKEIINGEVCEKDNDGNIKLGSTSLKADGTVKDTDETKDNGE